MHQVEREDLVIAIAWIGHTLDPDYDPHRKIIDDSIEYREASINHDQLEEPKKPSQVYAWYELTHLGEPICLNEHLCEISKAEGVHVLLLDDYQSDLGTNI